MHNQRTLIVGTEKQDFEELRSALQRHGRRAWFAQNVLGALRSFEELEPTEVVIFTGVDGGDPETLARICHRASPSARITFLVQHPLELDHFANVRGVGPVRTEFKPLDPYEIFGLRDEQGDEEIDGIPRSGEAEPTQLTAFLAALVRRRETGALFLNQGRLRKILYLVHGELVWAESNILAENFGQFLLRRGVINGIELNWARSLQMRENIRQGEALVKIGVLTESDLDELLAEQIRDKCVNALRMPMAKYRFTNDRQFLATKPRVPINPLRILTEALDAGPSANLLNVDVQPTSRLQLHAGLDDYQSEVLSASLGAEGRESLRSGHTLGELADAEGRDESWAQSFAKACDVLGLAHAVAELDDAAQAALISLPEPGSAEANASALSVEDRIQEIGKLADKAAAQNPLELLDTPHHTSGQEAEERLAAMESRLTSPAFGRGLPVSATMQLTSILDAIRRAREELIRREAPGGEPIPDADQKLQAAVETLEGGDPAGAASALSNLLDSFPRHTRFRVYHALALFLADESDESDSREQLEAMVERLQERDPMNADAYYVQGRMREALKDTQQARRCYLSALALEPDHGLAQNRLKQLVSSK